MDQQLIPYVSFLTMEERRKANRLFLGALMLLLATGTSFLGAVFLLVYSAGTVWGLLWFLMPLALAITTLRAGSRRSKFEAVLLAQVHSRFIDQLFLSHGVIPATRPPCLNQFMDYYETDNQRVTGIASLGRGGELLFARGIR